jgi:hypothetical protein
LRLAFNVRAAAFSLTAALPLLLLIKLAELSSSFYHLFPLSLCLFVADFLKKVYTFYPKHETFQPDQRKWHIG